MVDSQTIFFRKLNAIIVLRYKRNFFPLAKVINWITFQFPTNCKITWRKDYGDGLHHDKFFENYNVAENFFWMTFISYFHLYIYLVYMTISYSWIFNKLFNPEIKRTFKQVCKWNINICCLIFMHCFSLEISFLSLLVF